MSKTDGTQPINHNTDDDVQSLGHQVTSLVGVIIVSLVDFGVPLTPAQQSNILSIIVYGWAVGSTAYGIRRNVVRKRKRAQRRAKHKNNE